MFHFGERRPTTTARGEPTEVGEYALHVQCAWRITRGDKVLTARRDMYVPADGSDPTDDFDWQQTPNLQDKIIGNLFRRDRRELMVQSVEVGAAGRLHAVLDEGFALDVMPDDSLSHEHWRLFVPRSTEPHFVVTGDGVAAE